ncbi:MAG: dienelactone hydrolase family protein [Bacteroidota bacterium]
MSSFFQKTLFILFSVLLTFGAMSCSSEPSATKTAVKRKPSSAKFKQSNFKDTIKGIYSKNGKKIAFSQLSYHLDSTDKNVSFILFLHGAGERGIDNEAHLKVGLPNLVNSLKNAGLKNFVVLAPQCPLNERWVDVDWSTTSHVMKKNPHWPMELVFSLMDSITGSNTNFDTSCFYVTGLSMGGYGTWEVLQRRPEVFAAAIPICGGGDKLLGRSLVKIPIWMFHGTKDKAVPVVRTTDMFTSIKKELGSYPLKAKMTIYENKGHLIWNETYDNQEVIKWFITQRKNS